MKIDKPQKITNGSGSYVQTDMVRYWAGDFDPELTRNLPSEAVVAAQKWLARKRASQSDDRGSPQMRARVAREFRKLADAIFIPAKTQRRKDFVLDLSKGPHVFDADGPVTLSREALQRLMGPKMDEILQSSID